MVMAKQPEGMRRVKRTEADGKTTEYTIYLGDTEVGFSRRVAKGSVSSWEGYARTGEGTYETFPSQHKDHNALMTELRDNWLAVHGAAPAAESAEPKAAKSRKPKAAKQEEAAPAAQGIDQPLASSPQLETTLPDGAASVLPEADPGAQARVEAAYDGMQLGSSEPVTSIPAGATVLQETFEVIEEPDGTEEAVVAETVTEPQPVAQGDLQPDGVMHAAPASPPAVVFQPGHLGDALSLADPLADPLSPAFIQPGA